MPLLTTDIYNLCLVVICAMLAPILTSYFGVVIERGFRASLYKPSHCDGCGKRLSAWQLVPVVAAAWLLVFKGAKSSCCGKPISKLYFATEFFALVAGIAIGLGLVQLTGASLAIKIFFIAFSVVFLFLAVEDIWHLEVTMGIVWVLLGLGVILALLTVSGMGRAEADLPLLAQLTGDIYASLDLQYSLTSNLLAGAIGGVVVLALIALSKGKGLGTGDIYLVVFMGITLGPVGLIISTQLAIYIATVVGLAYALKRKQFHGLIVPLVPFLFLGWLLTIVLGAKLLIALNMSYILV